MKVYLVLVEFRFVLEVLVILKTLDRIHVDQSVLGLQF
jgi:hypothetical protein